ncbi:alpha-L-rhamnosidase C-terminal domain-containing protein [Roseibacillus ishigakijimensis]|uniref:alpha-L-rhamnosidase n=1 Tax=Roseibacillus ishigakijimensis TaxID=454146 RepID=A0A934RQC3_9BACT|nr:alpha-L-rhamnosidase C-terminal domain-containing protein [Roseibacillus ishigakijimensis]MBK1835544.1 hypothetical protein [Roseibacillus ishigakijimensis]
MTFATLLPLALAVSLPLAGQEIGPVHPTALQNSAITVNGENSLRFSWQIKAEGRGQIQNGYQILVAANEENLAPDKELVWDSGQVESGQSIFLPYEGPELTKGQDYHWQVRLWSQTGEELTASEWSAPASFTYLAEEKTPPAAEARLLSSFESSDEDLNQLFVAAQESAKTVLGPPARFAPGDKAWGAPLHLSARGFAFQADLADYYRVWLQEIVAEQGGKGLFPARLGGEEKAPPAPGHSDAALVIPFALWQLTGDPSFVDIAFEPAIAHLAAQQRLDADFAGQAYGESEAAENSPSPDFLALCYFSLDARIASEMATAKSHLPYIMQHKVWFDNLRKGFEKRFLDEEQNLTESSQSAQILALRFSLLPPEGKEKMAKALSARLQQEGLQADPFGTAAILPVLSWTNHHEQAVTLARSFGQEEAEPSPVALASTAEWMMSFLAGFIHQAPGFKTLRVAPFIPADGSITEVKAHHDTPYGRLAIHWKTTEKGLSAQVTIPPNTTGVIALPADEKATLTESGKPLEESLACQFMRDLEGRKEIIAQSGTYNFEVVNP